MMKPWRLLPMAVALGVTVNAGVAAAQTVIVRSAPQGSTIEVQVNAEDVKSATADSYGDATLDLRLLGAVSQRNVHFFVDVCSNRVRVRVVEQGLQPAAAEPACRRIEVSGLFVMRSITTFVVDLDAETAVVHLRQGPAPLSWVGRGEAAAGRAWGTPRTGLQLSAGLGLATFTDFGTVACGTVTSCSTSNLKGAVTVEAAFWIKRFLAAQVSYVKPARVTASGSEDTFRFDSALDTKVVTVAANVGGPVGPARVYAIAGMNHHQASFTTTETINDTTVVVDSVTRTIKGGTQSFELKTAGWGWLFGGGFELWATRPAAFYMEGQYGQLKGPSVSGGEGAINDHLFVLQAGVRVHIGR